MRTFKLEMEYGSDPIWETFEDGSDNLDHNQLPINEDLKQTLDNWRDQFQSTFNAEYPPDGGFSSEAEQEAFEEQGQALWTQLRQALGPNIALEPYQRHNIGVRTKVLA